MKEAEAEEPLRPNLVHCNPGAWNSDRGQEGGAAEDQGLSELEEGGQE